MGPYVIASFMVVADTLRIRGSKYLIIIYSPKQ